MNQNKCFYLTYSDSDAFLSILNYIVQFLLLTPSHFNLFMQACHSNVVLLLIGGHTEKDHCGVNMVFLSCKSGLVLLFI